MTVQKAKRALISVSDKNGVVEFAKELIHLDFEIISTGGTYKTLKESGIDVTYISEITGFPEILGGRVKTLHPMIHGGILGCRDNLDHKNEMTQEGIRPIDLVAVNLYPFQKVAANENSSWEELIENIDIGGPAMIRSAAKNHNDVIIAVDPADYPLIISQLKDSAEVSLQMRIKLAIKAYTHTAEYDSFIQETLRKRSNQEEQISFVPCIEKSVLRYGENPGQTATLYKKMTSQKSLVDAEQLHGKELSYNNWLDTDSAFRLIQEFEVPAAVIIKHTNPCGVAIGLTVYEAFQKAYEADSVSAFGGILAVNQTVDKDLATEINKTFWEVVVAPEFSEEALQILKEKKNLRLLKVTEEAWKMQAEKEWKSIQGGWLVQDRDLQEAPASTWKVVSKGSPDPSILSDYDFAWKVVKHVKSNAIVIAKNGISIGVGAGQMNRVGSAKIALEQAGDRAQGAVLASDAFFPFGDTVELASTYGIVGIIQPGGSIRDQESTDVADLHDMVMIHTDVRHFRH